MLLVGNKHLQSENITYIKSKDEIENTLPNSTVIFDFDLETMKYCEQNDVAYGVILTSIKEAIYSNALYAKYIICQKDLSSTLQELATNYLFDSKILALIEKDDEIEEIALKNIDGVIYKSVLDS